MQKKDFELIARVLRTTDMIPFTRQVLAAKFADELKALNPNFDKGRFIDTCQFDMKAFNKKVAEEIKANPNKIGTSVGLELWRKEK